MKRLPILLILTICLLAACARAADPAPRAADPSAGAAGGDPAGSSDMVKPVGGDLRIGEPWYLVGGMLQSPTAAPVTLTFDTADVAGQGPVNSYSTTYTATMDGGLELGEWTSTLVAGPEDLMAAESELMGLLAEVDGYTTVEGGELYLFDGDLNVLTYSTAQR